MREAWATIHTALAHTLQVVFLGADLLLHFVRPVLRVLFLAPALLLTATAQAACMMVEACMEEEALTAAGEALTVGEAFMVVGVCTTKDSQVDTIPTTARHRRGYADAPSLALRTVERRCLSPQ